MKKIVSISIVILIICALCLPLTAFAAEAEQGQKLEFNKKHPLSASSDNFRLTGVMPERNGYWGDFNITSDKHYQISRIEANVISGGADFDKVTISCGQKRESGSVPDNSLVYFDEIHSPTFSLRCNKGTTRFSYVTVYCEPRQYKYIDEKGEKITLSEDADVMNNNTTMLENGWYVVDSQLDFGDQRIETRGNVNIVLLDNCGITTSGGIGVKEGSLNIYSESLDAKSMGYINVTGAPDHCAGIGSERNQQAAIAITIAGGRITVTGGRDAAAIGNGSMSFCECTVTITGGIIDAKSMQNVTYGGAGIGSGRASSRKIIVDISGGDVTAAGYYQAPGIGAGSESDNIGCEVKISGGNITATGGQLAPGIGAAKDRSKASVVITGGTINAKGGSGCNVDIGSGEGSSCTVDDRRAAGFTLSGGSWWIIGIGAVVILGGIIAAAVIVGKKKKKA